MKAQTKQPDRLVTVKEALDYAHLGRSKLYDLMATGKVIGVKRGRTTLVNLDSIDAYHRSLPQLCLRRNVHRRR